MFAKDEGNSLANSVEFLIGVGIQYLLKSSKALCDGEYGRMQLMMYFRIGHHQERYLNKRPQKCVVLFGTLWRSFFV